MIGSRGEGTVKVFNVMGHADQAMVDGSDVRNEDRIGNDGADKASDLDRVRQKGEVYHCQTCSYPCLKPLVSYHPMTWDQGSIIKPRASSLRVTIDHASLPGQPGFWTAFGMACSILPSLWRMLLSGPPTLPFF